MEIVFFYESFKVAFTSELVARRSSTKMILSWCFLQVGDPGRGRLPLGLLISG